MLSKYYECLKNNGYDFEPIDDREVINTLLSNGFSSPERLNCGGTLGQLFTGIRGSKKKFIKTCIHSSEAVTNLEKEIYIMKSIYSEELEAEDIKIKIGDEMIPCLIMDYIDMKSKRKCVEKPFLEIKNVETQIQNLDRSKINYDWRDFLFASKKSYSFLSTNEYIDDQVSSFLECALKEYETYINHGLSICHGDMSNSNMTFRDGKLILLDWEDAMINVENYDLLYWLTFMSQRKYYGNSLFDDLQIDKQFGKNIMAMILSVKSHLSIMNGSIRNNSLSINDRIKEIVLM